jgi:phosphoribosylamine--glycine ligase
MYMAKVLLIDPNGDALDIAIRAQNDGHKVKLFIRDKPREDKIGLGFVEVIRSFDLYLLWADIIICADNTLYTKQLDAHREKHGTPIIAPTVATAAWELDRDVGQKVFKKHGIEVPAYRMFSKYDEALDYVRKENRRFVCKPCGDMDKSLSYVAKTPADMVYMLERWKRANKHKGSFILQDFIPGIEMAVGGWFGPGGFNVGWCENWEFKKLMNDDLGVATGEMGTVVRYVRTSKLANKVLRPLEDALDREKYCGYVDVNCIISEDGTPWPLEFTMRPGWPTFNIQQALHTGDSIEWLLKLYGGKDARSFLLNQVAVGVVLSIPQFPYKGPMEDCTGVPVQGITTALWPNIHPLSMMMGKAPCDVGGAVQERPCPLTAGDCVLVASGVGETVSQAKEAAYRRIKRLSVPSSPMYRTDIGDRLVRQLPKLQAMGYATGMTFSTN